MRIGPLRHRVTLQQRSTTLDSYGQESGALSNIAPDPVVWADVRPTTGADGAERFLAGAEQVQATLTHRVTMRYRTDLTVEMVIIWDGNTLDIESIQDPSGKRQYLVLMCREIIP